MATISIIIIASACFCAAILNLAVENRRRNQIMSVFGAASALLGLALYGYGYSHASDLALVAVVRTIMSVCMMFGGSNDWEGIWDAPLFAYRWIIIIFWMVHFIAFYATASAAIALIGTKVLRKLRLALSRRGTLLVIYGVNADALAYGKRQINVLHRSVVFIGQGDASVDAAVSAAGGVLERNGEHPNTFLLRKLGIRPGKRPIEIAALHEDGAKNAAYVRKLLAAFEAAGILPEQTRLLVRDVDEDQAGFLTASQEKYGYGSVMLFDEYDLAARLMVQELPPCDTIRFDENARARQDFRVLIIGFGRMGRAALDALLMNGQFAGSTFRADVFDAKAQNGMLFDHEILKQYDVRFHKHDGKSDELYAFLNENKDAIRYIVLCTGDAKENREIARDLDHWLDAHGASPAIVQCTGHALTLTRPDDREQAYRNIYGTDALDLERIDRMAMAINHAYSRDSGKTPWENWKQCDYFGRMSSRASADFYPAVLKAAGKAMQQVESGDWPPQGEMLENLAITEHLRWCAFHYVMGFHPMTEEELAQRIDRYRKEVQEKGASSVRIGKDMANRKHACLIPWEDLDRLSEIENAATGKQLDYKQMDRNNILVLPDILKVLREMPGN